MVGKKIIILFFSILLLTSCTKREDIVIPEGILGKDKMVEVFTTIHLIEGARTGFVITGDKESTLHDYYKALYENAGVTEAQFDSSFVFYVKHPVLMDGIYEQVIENLSVIESELSSD